MKTFVKGLSALIICGTFVFTSGGTAEAAESSTEIAKSAITEFNVDSLQIEELGFRHDRRRPYPPPPPPPPPPLPPPPPPVSGVRPLYPPPPPPPPRRPHHPHDYDW